MQQSAYMQYAVLCAVIAVIVYLLELVSLNLMHD